MKCQRVFLGAGEEGSVWVGVDCKRGTDYLIFMIADHRSSLISYRLSLAL